VKLFSTNLGGNLHDATNFVNRMGWATNVVHFHCTTGHNSIIILRFADDYDPEAAMRATDRTTPPRSNAAAYFMNPRNMKKGEPPPW